jgi:release factor glutamine methyltransferase
MTALKHIKDITEFLKRCDIDNAAREAELILMHILGIDKVKLYRDAPELSSWKIRKIDKILERRAKREPLQYILGNVEFHGIKIRVGSGVLVPRPETELIVDEVIKTVENYNSKIKILDLCTGSGCIALAIAKKIPDSYVLGADISNKAIRYAKKNSSINKIKNVRFFCGTLFEPVAEFYPFDIIIANPPYIKTSDIQNLQPEIKDWEPLGALDGGEDGLKYYREILSNAKKYLAENGTVLLEIGYGQSAGVYKIAKANSFKNIVVMKDFSEIDRIISLS